MRHVVEETEETTVLHSLSTLRVIVDASGTRRYFRLLLVVALVLGGAVALSGGASAASSVRPAGPGQPDATKDAENEVPNRSTGVWIVQLADPPVAAYSGGVRGYPATRPTAGQTLDLDRAEAQGYASYLAERRDAVLADAGLTQPLRTFSTAFNGFSAKLSEKQIEALRKDSRVARVTEARWMTPLTVRTPTVLGLNAPGGLWEQLGGTGSDGAGEDMVIGVVDSGIRPENPSFAGGSDPPPADWNGTCETGEEWPSGLCNDKLIGARYFPDGFIATFGQLPDNEVASARDVVGHGTHTASTAAGNHGPNASVGGQDRGSVSGMAPAAHVAAYKVLWDGVGVEDDIVAAIDAAVADGVDVINFSVGPAEGDVQPVTPTGEAFLNATLAGVFVAAAAGNDNSTRLVSNTYPWVTTVAAGVHTPYEGTVRLGDGTEVVGLTVDRPTFFQAPLVASFDIPAAGVEPADAVTCQPGTIDLSRVGGKAVICSPEPLLEAQTARSLRDAGAAGAIFYGASAPGTFPIDNVRINRTYRFPVVYLPRVEQMRPIMEYLVANPGSASARLVAGGDESTAPGFPSVADFSSKGPNQVSPNLLKPDITAPGVDVIAGTVPSAANGFDNYAFNSGTSMAAPHVAGIAALVKQARPGWSPAAIKSALATTASDTVGTTSPFAQGSGWVRPNVATDPGLVFEPTVAQWQDYQGGNRDGKNINNPSVALEDFTGTVTLTRTVRSVSDQTETYDATVAGLSGLPVTMSPSQFTIAPGATQELAVTVSASTVARDTYYHGEITLSSGDHTARLPVAARPDGITVAGGSGQRGCVNQPGSTTTTVIPAFSGTLTTEFYGLQAPPPGSVHGIPGGHDAPFVPGGPGTNVHTFTVAPGTPVVHIALDEVTTGIDYELEPQVFLDGRRLFTFAGIPGAPRRVTLIDPEPGDYTVYVKVRAIEPGQEDTPISYRYTLSQLERIDQGNVEVSVDPQPVVAGEPARVTVNYDALGGEAGDPYHIGHIAFRDGSIELDGTAIFFFPVEC